jgi:hydrogenase/urease accessory protein HupE
VYRFAFADDNHDGKLDERALQHHAAELQKAFSSQFHLQVGGREAVAAAETFVMLPHANTPNEGYDYLIIAQQYHLPATTGPVSLQIDWLREARPTELLTVRATRGQEADLMILSPEQPGGRLFLNAWQTLLRYLPVGMEHILFGLDHLLFLLTVVVAGASWRYWLTVVTSFTLAHSVTLTLSTLNIMAWPSGLVEPLIALSIVLMGADNLLRQQVSTLQRAGFVFLCGLLHGMGFAGAVGSAGLSSSHKLASIAGFNFGIELGQATFLISLGLVGWLAQRRFSGMRQLPARKLASVTAVVLGLGMMGSRIVG